MSNVAGKAYGMNVLTPMWPWMTWVNRLLFMAARVFPTGLVGLLGLSFIHFARWTIITRDQWPKLDPEIAPQQLANDYMLFCSNFNGTWDQYIDAFSDGIPGGLDLFLVFHDKLHAFHSNHTVQEFHQAESSRHKLLLQLRSRRRAMGREGGAAPAPSPHRTC